MARILIEAESFSHRGGWVVDSASMEQLHSSYLMAHGMGIPVEDARTVVTVPREGTYTFWALTRDWTAVWNAAEPAGRFRLLVNGLPLSRELGTNGPRWSWQEAGSARLPAGQSTLALQDLTGFNGRCDALYLTDEGDVPSDEPEALEELRRELNWKEIREHETTFDLVVAGGGIAGICTALAAKRSGVRVALINDRAMLGGCNSSEVRVCMGGMIHLPPYDQLGNLVKEIAPVMGDPSIYREEYFEDHRKQAAFELREGQAAPHALFLNQAVTATEREGSRITAVICTDTLTGKKLRIRGRLFADCTGDGVLARAMGCQTLYGRESREEFGESLAPEVHEQLVMGHSIRWYSEECPDYQPFPVIDWGLHFTDESCLNCISGDWEQETGFTRDMVTQIEYIRDYGLRAIYSNWAFQKHEFSDRARFANRRLVWVSPVGGKREGCRVAGDHILTQQDIEEKTYYEDGTACLTWSIDMHFPEPTNLEQFGEAFRSFAYHRGVEKPYPVPYRCLYARDADNLFLGGRLVSTTHVAFSSIRVQRTLGALGEVAGIAAAVCREYDCTPRQVYTEHLDALRERLRKGVCAPDAFHCGVGSDESYHFKDVGWWWIHLARCQQPDSLEKFKKGVKFLGLKHKYPMPKGWE